MENANPVSVESNQLPQRKAWRGRCLVIVRSENKEGKILLRISTEAVSVPATIELFSKN